MNIPNLKSNARKLLIITGVLVAVFFLGSRWGAQPKHASSESAGHDHTESTAQDTLWTCVMHLQIKRSEPGLCPICSMELVPMSEADETAGANDRQLVMNEADKKLANIVTAAVERKFVDAQVRMVGKLEYDETKVKSISSWVNGRVDRLYVDYVGIQVAKGDHLVSLYSPDLVTGQEELIEAKRRVDNQGKEKSEFLRNSDLRSLESAREKLRLWGLSESQVREIEVSRKPDDHILINSPQAGIVIQKSLTEGQYVETGSHLLTVADLTSLWVKLDAYESDLQWLHYGQSVEIETEAYPGEIFSGLIAFIDPAVDPTTRTVKVRVNVDNPQQRLKPGMFVRATVHAKLAKGGKVMDAKLAGKWIAPMHPEIIRDQPGACPICGMDLVRAETLGYVTADSDEDAPLVIPATAVLRTGRRAVVYVDVPGADHPTYEGREIVLGVRAGDYYLVEGGLAEDERVVVQGNFNIDSAMQIKAQPSMMSMPGEQVSTDQAAALAPIRETLAPVYQTYLDVQPPMMQDDLATAQSAFALFAAQAAGVDMTRFPEPDQHDAWMTASKAFIEASTLAEQASSLDELRSAYDGASKQVLALERLFGHAGDQPYYEAYCPMAFGTGASWLQTASGIQNPFMGTSMPACGEIKNTFIAHTASGSQPAAAGAHNH